MTSQQSTVIPGDSSGADTAGPVSSSTITIGGEDLAVDPRGGSLTYSISFFNGNVNYGQTPLNLSIQYQQNAAGSYVGAFTDDDDHPHPYGVSAYLPTAQPKATEGDGSQLSDAGGIWDLNLPYLFISTSKVSKFYGSDQIAATLSLGDTSYQILLKMPSTSQEQYINDYTAGFIAAAQNSGPLYSVDGRLLNVGQGQQPDQIVVQDKYGTHFLFAAAVLYGYKGINIYDPTDNSSNNANADQLLVYRIINIFYANGQTLNFSYTDSAWTGIQQHTLSITDTIGNTIAALAWNDCTGTVSITNQADELVPTHQLTLSPGDYRLCSVKDITTNRALNFQYVVNQNVPYSWQNQTSLASIQNAYTGYQTEITYQQFNSNHAYDAGCNQFSLAEISVYTVTNKDNTGALISCAQYDFGFPSDGPNFVMPQYSGKKTYASGLNHWLDNIFYQNNDSDGCSSSDRVDAVYLTYATTITTTYQDQLRNRTQSKQFDALGRATQDSISNPFGVLTITSYIYQATPTELQSLSTFDNLPYSYGSPVSTISGVNIATLNGVLVGGGSDGNAGVILLEKLQKYTYSTAGNPTLEISPLGQMTEYTYLPAEQTHPSNERLVTSIKTHSIGNNGASFVLETQTFESGTIAPNDGGLFMTQATLPTSNVETHFDADSNTTYQYRTDTMGGYIGGYNYSDGINVGLNGILTLRGQEDNTGASNISTLQNQTTANFTTLPGQTQPVLEISSSIIGTTKAGQTTSMNRGGCLIHFMGYPLQQTNALGQQSLQTYDNIGRLISVTTLAGTEWSQTTSYAYDMPEDLILISGALYSRRQTDSYGNLHLQLFDARQRHIASFQTLNGDQQVQTAAYSYDDANNLTSATQYGNEYTRTTNYFYSPGTQLMVARVPNDGLAEGCIFDALNGITFRFKYAPATTTAPTTIGQIYGPVNMRQVDNSSHLLLADGQIDADAANAALSGFDLVAIPANTPIVALSGNPWLNTGQTAEPLLALYQAMVECPQTDPPPGSTCNWLELNTYDYDEWYRQVSSTRYTFVNHGEGLTTTPTLAITVNSRSFQTAERSITVTYPQGQSKTSSYNLLSGLQTATLSVNGIQTSLGNIQHDGLGRILTYNDNLNGSQSTATYATTGLLNSRSDAYGNTTTYTYDPVSFKLIQTSIVPADGGDSVMVTRQYDNHLNLIWAQDGQGNTQQWSFEQSGLLGTRSIRLGAVNPNCPMQTSFSYDAYGDLVHVADPFLPYPEQTGDGCSMVQSNSSSHGFNIYRDDRGRISQLLAGSFHGVNRTFNFHPVTGLLVSDTLANLPSTFGCGDTGILSLCTGYAYDNNLRTINKSITRSDTNGADATAQFSQSYDPSNRVASRHRQDFQGNLLNEYFSYDLQTGYLTGYANNGGSAAPFSAMAGLGAIGCATYTHDTYGNLLEVNLEGVGGASASALLRSYSYTQADADGTNSNPFRLLATQETILQNGNSFNRSGSFTYDQAGNVVEDGSGRSFTYDAHGLINSIQRADQQTETFVRDGLGRIIQRNAPWLNGAVHEFGTARYLESSQLWQSRFFAGTACCVGPLNNATPTAVNPVVEQPAFWSAEDLSRQAVNTLSYGGNNTGFLLLNATSHLPYGVATNLLNPDSGYPDDIDNPGAYPESVMGTAQGADVGTGLLILGDVRCFDPVLGRFLQWDGLSPFGKGGLNGYAYAGNDPVNFWDPSGHYRSAKSKRYGPKPLEAHHHSDGGFWDGFLAGFRHGVKAFYMTPYNYVKSFCLDLAHHHWVGALEMGFDAAVESTIQAEAGVLGTMVLQEFVTMSPSNIFSGKSPVKSSHSGHRSAYQWGYGLGNESGGVADAVALAIVTFVIGVVAEGAANLVESASSDAASTEAAADANVSGDANTINRLRISEATNGHDDQLSIRTQDGEGEHGGQSNGEGSDAESLSRSQRVLNGLRKLPDLVFRKVILPHDPEDPFPWEENLTSGQRAKAFVTVTSEALNETRKFVTHLASWGGTSQPTGETSSGSASGRNSSTSPADDQGLDPQHQHTASGQNSTPCLPPIPPPPNLPGR